MAGVYLHIPFCKQACSYCDFHFSTSLKLKSPVLDAMKSEIAMRKNYLDDKKVDTIYLGGGTPSLLKVPELHDLFETLDRYFEISPDAEVTLEANPDDLIASQLRALAQSPVNRLSIGIQSFLEEELKMMNRAHNAAEAVKCVQMAQDAGFDNITGDLIYGGPLLDDDNWRRNLDKFMELRIPHLSAYALTIEPKTLLHHWIKKGQYAIPEDDQFVRQFALLRDISQSAGYEQYEISNFCQPGYLSQHNSNYWKGVSYLGIGPSAHSYDGKSRQWNVANNAKYVKAMAAGEAYFERELLDQITRYNEYVLTRLRTKWGCALEEVESKFGADLTTHLTSQSKIHLKNGDLEVNNGILLLTEKGKLVADKISAELFATEDDR